MAVKGGPNIVTQGLNLSLDSGNKKSIPLDPTVNQYLNPQFLNNTASWQFGSWSDLIYTYQTVNAPGPDGITIPMLKITRISGSTGAAHFHQGNNGKYYSGSAFTMTAYVSGSGTFTGRHQNLGVLGTYTLSNNWQRVAYTFTQPNNTNYPYWAADQITFNESLYFVYAQSENLPYASPYVSGSRTNWNNIAQINTTASLLAASNTSSIPQFQSLNSGLLNFDGTGSSAAITSSWSYLSSSAIEAVFAVDRFGTSEVVSIGGYDQIDTSTFSRSVAGMIYLQNNNKQVEASVITLTQAYRTVSSTTVINTGSYYHVVFNKDTTTGTLQLYINGRLESTNTFDTGSYAQWFTTGSFYGSNIIRISNTLSGNIASWSNKYFSGKIPIFKLYSRTLTATEVLQNYNAQKTRFGL